MANYTNPRKSGTQENDGLDGVLKLRHVFIAAALLRETANEVFEANVFYHSKKRVRTFIGTEVNNILPVVLVGRRHHV